LGTLSVVSIFDPLCDRSSVFTVADSVLPGSIEQNPKLTVKRSARYTLPKIIEEMLKGH